jgi:hypothetical protein
LTCELIGAPTEHSVSRGRTARYKWQKSALSMRWRHPRPDKGVAAIGSGALMRCPQHVLCWIAPALSNSQIAEKAIRIAAKYVFLQRIYYYAVDDAKWRTINNKFCVK